MRKLAARAIRQIVEGQADLRETAVRGPGWVAGCLPGLGGDAGLRPYPSFPWIPAVTRWGLTDVFYAPQIADPLPLGVKTQLVGASGPIQTFGLVDFPHF